MATTYFLLFVSRFQQIFPPSYSYMPFPSLSPEPFLFSIVHDEMARAARTAIKL